MSLILSFMIKNRDREDLNIQNEKSLIFLNLSSSTLPKQDHMDCFEDDQDVKGDTQIFDVIEIVAELFDGVFHGGAVGI